VHGGRVDKVAAVIRIQLKGIESCRKTMADGVYHVRVEERLCGECLELADVIWDPRVVGGCLRVMIEGFGYLLGKGN
jgi:hypothetical protein